MATQIKVNSATGNVTVQLSRTVIGTVVTANTANYANFAGTAETANNLSAATTANVVIGGGVNGYVLQTNGAGITSWVAQAGGGGSVPGGANTEVQYNDEGTMAGDPAFTFNDVTSTLTTGTISATNIGNITPTNLDGNVANVLRGDGTFAADAGGTYGDSNVVTLLDAFGSNTITTTGLITANGGGLSNITGANVTGEVPFAAVANSVALANVAGAGNIASINLDGNVANVLSGDGTFIAAGAGGTYGDSNVTTLMGAFGSNTITTTGNVSVGNLVADPSLLVNGVNGNVLIQPNVAFNSKTYSSLIRGEYDTGTGNTTTNQAFITDNYTTQGITAFDSFANTAAGQLASGPTFGFNNYAAIGNANTDPLVAGQINFFANPSSANLAKADTGTGTSMTMGGGGSPGFLTVIGSESGDSYGSGAWKQFQYRPKAMDFIRRGGNADNRQSPVANDETSLNFYTTQTSGGVPGQLYNYPAKIGSKVDPGWTDPNNPAKGTPEGVFFTVVTEDFANLEHRMYANGDTIFNTSGGGTPITLGYNGVLTGDGGGLSNVSTGAVGNLSSLTVNDSVANSTTHQIDPALLTIPVNYTDTKAQEVITMWGDDITPNYFGGNSTTTFLMNDINASTPGFSPIITDYAASNGAGGYSQSVRVETGMDFVGVPPSGTNAYAPGRVQYTFAGPDSDLTNADTLGEVKFSQGGIAISPRTTTATQTGIINVFYYGTNASDPTDANGLDFTRRRGNNASRVDIAAGDYLGNIRWAGRKASGFQGNKARIGGRVSPSYNGTDNNIPTDLFMNTQDNGGVTSTWEYGSDGDTFMPGNLTLNNAGIFTGDGGGLSNVSATASPGGFFDSVQFNNNGVLDGDSTLTYNTGSKQFTLNGQAAGVGGVPTFNINNGGFNVNQEEIGGGAATFAFNNYYAGGLIAPTTFFRAKGTRSAPTAVASGDQISNEGFYVNAGFNGYFGLGSVSATVNTVNADGNASMNYDITTNQSDQYKNDKIILNTSTLNIAGNVTMTGTQDDRMRVKRLSQTVQTLSQLQALVGTIAGERGFISDGTGSGAVNFGGLAVDGGTVMLPVYFDGSDWRFG